MGVTAAAAADAAVQPGSWKWEAASHYVLLQVEFQGKQGRCKLERRSGDANTSTATSAAIGAGEEDGKEQARTMEASEMQIGEEEAATKVQALAREERSRGRRRGGSRGRGAGRGEEEGGGEGEAEEEEVSEEEELKKKISLGKSPEDTTTQSPEAPKPRRRLRRLLGLQPRRLRQKRRC